MYTINKKKRINQKTQNKQNWSLTSKSIPSLHIKMVSGSDSRTPLRWNDFSKFLYLFFTWLIEVNDNVSNLPMLPKARILKPEELTSNWLVTMKQKIHGSRKQPEHHRKRSCSSTFLPWKSISLYHNLSNC